MRIKCLLTAITLLFTINLTAQKPDFRELENNAFQEGEKLTFDVRYGPITAGIAEMHIPRTLKIFGRDVYQITFRVNSVPAFDPFYKVRDRYETYLDVKGIFPWRFEQHIREGGYKRDFSAFFDHINGIAKTSKDEYEIPRYTNDIVSALYYVRTMEVQNYEKDDVIHLKNFYKDKVYPLDVIYRGTERVTVDAGTFDCFILEPLVVEGGLFKSEGSIMVWLTDDELNLPVKVKTKVVIGSINAELTKYEGLAGEIEAKVEK